MIQFGQNAGPRHLRVFGHVRNLKDSSMPSSERIAKDHRLLGVFAFTWNLFLAISPVSTINACNSAMEKADVPQRETGHDNSSKISYV
jgi:hypothetical protein